MPPSRVVKKGVNRRCAMAFEPPGPGSITLKVIQRGWCWRIKMRSLAGVERGIVFHRLHGVAGEVEQHLFDHRAVAHGTGHRRRQVDLDPLAALAGLQAR